MVRKRNKFINLQPWEYNPTTLKGLDIKDLRSLYSAKRDIAQKRLKRLRQSEFRKNHPALDYKKGIPTLKQIKSTSEKDVQFEKNILTYELSKLQHWLDNEYTKVGKLKEAKSKSLATLHEHGYDWVTASNYMEYVEFQNYLTRTGLDRLYDSDQVIVSSDTDRPDTVQLKQIFYTYRQRGGSLPPEMYMNR